MLQWQKVQLEVRRAGGRRRRRTAGAVPAREPRAAPAGGRGAAAGRQPGAAGEGGAQAAQETPQQAEEAAAPAVQRPLGADGGEVRRGHDPHTSTGTPPELFYSLSYIIIGFLK